MEKGWTEVYITAHDYKAEMAKEILENEGIQVVVMNQHDSAIQSIGNFYLYVAEKDEAMAIELIKNLKL